VLVRVLEDTDQVLHLTLPQKPSSEELDEAALDCVAGGAGTFLYMWIDKS
jgi:hypothetical protein